MAPMHAAIASLLLSTLPAQQAQPTRTEHAFRLRGQPQPGAEAAAIQAGLAWLRANNDGERWTGADPDDRATSISVTSLAVLAMLGDGSTLRSGPSRGQIKIGIVYLRAQQRNDGAFLPAESDDVLLHALATTAMVEAYAMSDYRLLLGNANAGLKWLETQRRPEGTFGLLPGGKADAVATLWCRWAGMTGEIAEIVQQDEHLPGLHTWLGSDDADRLLERSLLPVQAAPGTDLVLRRELDTVRLALEVFVREKANPINAAQVAKVRDRRREWQPGVNLHEWLCASHMLQQVGTAQEIDRLLAPLLVGQNSTGKDAGSWDPIDLSGATGGRAGTTAMAVLTLQAKTRYAKRFR